jgi:hypothetical protein
MSAFDPAYFHRTYDQSVVRMPIALRPRASNQYRPQLRQRTMKAVLQVVSLLAVSMALTVGSDNVFAKTNPAKGAQVSGTPASVSVRGAGASGSPPKPPCSDFRPCLATPPPSPPPRQPPCGHMGRNGVMIQCQ